MARRSTRRMQSKDTLVPELVKLWILRILVPLRGHVEFFSGWNLHSQCVVDAIGLKTGSRCVTSEQDGPELRGELERLHLAGETRYRDAAIPEALAANTERLSQLVGLSPVDRRVLEFVVLLQNFRLLADAAESLGMISTAQVIESLAAILDLAEEEVRVSLATDGLLTQSGLVTLERSGQNSLARKLDPLSTSFAESLMVPGEDIVAILRDIVAPGSAATLRWSDYEHLQERLTIVRAYLGRVLETRRKGVNILVHGRPGTGKTELARVVARELGCELFEVACVDKSGDPIDGEHRLRAYRAAQCFFAGRSALLLFDEIEDIFTSGEGFFRERSIAQKHKAWMNRALELNPVPTLWISNSVGGLDDAFIRRFDIVLELPVPPRNQRARIIREACGNMLDPSGVARIAEVDALTPAIITRAASVVGAVRGEVPEERVSAAIESLVGSTLEAQGYPPLARNLATRLPDYYDVSLLNAGTDLNDVADGLVRSRSGRLCLYGPPGTGKTAFGRWLADRLGTPLYVRRASDLLSRYVGGTERNIATAFHEASEDGAVLLLDEVDSFLRERSMARHGWEVSEVNEMLAQMECFDGVLIASTNLMDDIDQAALRRFDLKLKFDYLQPDQAWLLFNRQCTALGLPPPPAGMREEVASLASLTPGDYAAVARQHRFRPFRSPDDALAALRAECAIKHDAGARSIGFLA